MARKESIKLIINKIEEVNSEQLPVFLTADFNSDTDESCFNPLHQVMKDARATAPVTDQEATKHLEPVNLTISFMITDAWQAFSKL